MGARVDPAAAGDGCLLQQGTHYLPCSHLKGQIIYETMTTTIISKRKWISPRISVHKCSQTVFSLTEETPPSASNSRPDL